MKATPLKHTPPPMPSLKLDTIESAEEIVGLDVTIHTRGFHGDTIGRITEATVPDDPYENPEDINITVEEHLRDRTVTLTGKDAWTVETAEFGDEYTVYWGEVREDGEWTRVTDQFLGRHKARDYLHHNTDADANTRLTSQTYTAGAERAERWPLRAGEDGISCVLEGRNTLPETLSALDEGQRITVVAGTDYKVVATITGIDPEPVDCDPQTASSVNASAIGDEFTVTAEDTFGGTVTVEYSRETNNAVVEREPPEEPPTPEEGAELPDCKHPDNDPGEFDGRLRGLNARGNPVEYYDIPWLNQLQKKVDIPDEIGDRTAGMEVGEVWTAPSNRFELYSITVEIAVQKRNTGSITHDLVTATKPMTFPIES